MNKQTAGRRAHCMCLQLTINQHFIQDIVCHYNDVIMRAMASQITSLTIVTQPFIQAQMKENIKAPHHWPL